MAYIDITSEEFAEKVLNAPQMAIVNFWTERSGSCQIQNPEFEVISKEYEGRVTFTRLNVEENSELTNRWGVDGVPTMIFFKNGQEIHRIKGIMMRDKLRRQVEGTLLVAK